MKVPGVRAKVKDNRNKYDRMVRNIKKKSEVYIGILQENEARDNVGGGNERVAEYATKLEFGTREQITYTSHRGNTVRVKGIPPRPFIRRTMTEDRGKIIEAARIAWDDILIGKTTYRNGLADVGMLITSLIKRRINSNMSPANSPAVIKDKGSNKTLFDTGRMVNSIDYVIREK